MIISSQLLSRRGLLQIAGTAACLAALPAAALAATSEAYQPGGNLRSLSIDTQGLADRGLSNYAVRIQRLAQPIIDAVFADRRAPGNSDAPHLVVKIDEILLSSEGDQAVGGIGTADNYDWISGAGVLTDAHGKVLSVKPIQTADPAYGGGGADVLTIENIRTQRLITQFAEFIKQAI